MEADLHTRRAATPTPMVMKLVACGKKLGKSVENEFLNPLECWEESSLGPIVVSPILARKCFTILTTYSSSR